ncbi:hypothetical protein MATL_G00182720 [Megalops atlanticus]|uniref:tRNA N(3)-cytidine methyltransferase n=1 Tax=Megalops atlanticus TaxID=7932 RepID=A0A9D3PML8_MEGAT|nr:hypothetical protein MATL_G00182720 [Megalops atlanticus]
MRRAGRLPLASVVRSLLRVPCRPSSREGRPPAPLGARILTNPDHIFQHNMWDHVQWSEEDKENARQKVEKNSSVRIPPEEQVNYDRNAHLYWDGFYEMHQNKFFKDRTWLFQEFPELLSAGPAPPCGGASAPQLRDTAEGESLGDCEGGGRREGGETGSQAGAFPGSEADFRILEVGCGAGNSVFPILSSINSGTFLYCCDFSPRAVQLVKAHPAYDPSLCHTFVQDVCEEASLFPFPPGSLNVILLIFVLSSIHPERMQGVLNRLSQYLKPGGMFLFRDYGRYDLSQLRFKTGRCLSENFYSRGDGTCVYFFTKDEVHHLFTSAGLKEVQNLEDRRLQVNRRKKVVMRRVWMQSKYQKPL